MIMKRSVTAEERVSGCSVVPPSGHPWHSGGTQWHSAHHSWHTLNSPCHRSVAGRRCRGADVIWTELVTSCDTCIFGDVASYFRIGAEQIKIYMTDQKL